MGAYWVVLGSTGFNQTGSQQTALEIKESERYCAAVLLRRRQAESEAPFSVLFDISYTHHGSYRDDAQVTQNILVDRSESAPWTPLSWAAANGWEECVKCWSKKRGLRNSIMMENRLFPGPMPAWSTCITGSSKSIMVTIAYPQPI